MIFLEEASERQPQKAFIEQLIKSSVFTEDAFTTAKMTKVLEMLIDGKWHTLREIQQKTQLDKSQVHQVMKFLKRYGFVSVDETSTKVILGKTVQKFLAKKSSS